MPGRTQRPLDTGSRGDGARSDLTQRALAARAGCSAETVKKIEAGRLRPSGQLAALLVAALQMPPDEQAVLVQWARRGTPEPGPAPLTPPWPGQLPAPPTALIGREQEVAEILCAPA